MKYITNKELINKLQDYKKVMDFDDLSNKDHNLTIQTINEFISLIAVNDIDDDENTPFDIPLNFIENFEYEDLITEIAEQSTPIAYSDLTKWLDYDVKHIKLVDDFMNSCSYQDYKKDFDSIIEIINDTMKETLKNDLIKILTITTK